MAEFDLHTTDTAPADSVPLMEQYTEKLGFLPNVLGVLAESPVTLKAYVQLTGILGESSFSPAEQQILLLTTSRENECHYCVAAHTGGAKRAKAPQEVIDAIRDGTPIADARFAALHKFCSLMVSNRGWVAEADVDAFLEAGFTKAQMFEVLIAVAIKTISNYSNHIVETPLDEPFKPLAWKKDKAAA